MSKQESKPTKRIADPELQAMAKVDEILSGLDPKTLPRVVQWIADRYATDTVEPTRYEPTYGHAT